MKTILFLTILTQLALPQSKFSKLGVLMDEGGYKNAETTLYLTGQTVTPAQATRIDNFITMLKDSLQITALSSKFDVMYLLANESATLGLRNLVKRSHDATAVNSPTFTAYEGFVSNGTTSYIKTNYTVSTDGINFTLNSASIGAYSRTNNKGLLIPIGARTLSNTGRNYFYVHSDNKYYATVNQTATEVGEIITRADGMMVVSRVNSTEFKRYIKNSTDNVSATTSVVSTQVPEVQFYLLALNTANVPGLYCTNQISFAFIGGGLTVTEARQVTNCIEYYMDALGKGVIP